VEHVAPETLLGIEDLGTRRAFSQHQDAGSCVMIQIKDTFFRLKLAFVMALALPGVASGGGLRACFTPGQNCTP
jgi:hypothetical protein